MEPNDLEQEIDYTSNFEQISEQLNDLNNYLIERDLKYDDDFATYIEEKKINHESDIELFNDYFDYIKSNDESNVIYTESFLNSINDSYIQNDDFNTKYLDMITVQNEKLDTMNNNLNTVIEVTEPTDTDLQVQSLEYYAYLSIIFIVCICFPVYICYRYFMMFFRLLY